MFAKRARGSCMSKNTKTPNALLQILKHRQIIKPLYILLIRKCLWKWKPLFPYLSWGEENLLAYPSEYCIMRPFFDQPSQFGPGRKRSLRFKILTTFAGSLLVWFFAMLQTRRSPSWVWVANMSDFCFEEEACHARVTIGDGLLEVVKLWMIVNRGCKVQIRIEPFW